jgi:integrase/recombinase XerC
MGSMSGDLDLVRQAFVRHLRAENKSPKTVRSYEQTARLFTDWLRARPFDGAAPRVENLDEVRRSHVETWFGELFASDHKPSTVLTRYAGLQAFAKWASDPDEKIILSSFMAGVGRPQVPEAEPPVMSDSDIKALLATCKGTDFVARRDTAIIRLLIDSGIRVAECASLNTDDSVDLDDDVVRVVRKGRRGTRAIPVPFGARTGQALARYERLRAKHPYARLDAYWLGVTGRGPMTEDGIRQMLARRAAAAGLERVHPHLLRHTSVDAWLSAGGGEGDAMRIFGWRSRQMLDRYAAGRQQDRAIEAHRRLSPGDRI